jgi:phosphatidylserine/phosphatidylglycerophosphate/cardiolipin synthase-like enzyme
MTFYSYWDDPKTQSPLVDALVAAAERGVKVRVLLNDQKAFADETIFGSACPMQCQKSDPKQRKNHNLDTVNLLNQVPQARGLSLSAKIADLKAMGVAIIHNKGALVDQDKALISSINWNMNSISHNRETAVLLNSPEAYAYYADLFERDWQASDTQTRQQQ